MERRSGFTLNDYQKLFSLTDDDLSGRILEIGSGFSTFNLEASRAGAQVVSFDPVYAYEDEEFEGTMEVWLESLKSQSDAKGKELLQLCYDAFDHDFNLDDSWECYWSDWRSIEQTEDGAFDLVLAPYYFFHPEAGDLDQQFNKIKTLCRIGNELRLFPVSTPSNQVPVELGPIMVALQQDHYRLEVLASSSDLVEGEMLRVCAQLCEVTD